MDHDPEHLADQIRQLADELAATLALVRVSPDTADAVQELRTTAAWVQRRIKAEMVAA